MRSKIVYFIHLLTLFLHQITSTPLQECKNREFDKYLVSIQTDFKHRCTGVILNKNTVLTTATCVTDHIYRTGAIGSCDCSMNISIIYRVSASNMQGGSCAREIQVVMTKIHHKLTKLDWGPINNVAILKTKGDMDLDSNWRAPELSKEHIMVVDNCEAEAVVTGYWMNKTQKEPLVVAPCIDVLLYKNLCDVTESYLSNSSTSKPPTRVDLEPRVICQVAKNVKIASICKAFYGSPVFCREWKTNRTVLYGLLSHRPYERECEVDVELHFTRMQTFTGFLYPDL